MAWLVSTLRVSRAIEVGVFTGYSSLAVALALQPGGMLVACDRDERAMEVARRYWAEAGVTGRVRGLAWIAGSLKKGRALLRAPRIALARRILVCCVFMCISGSWASQGRRCAELESHQSPAGPGGPIPR